jgi:hypothetical protein
LVDVESVGLERCKAATGKPAGRMVSKPLDLPVLQQLAHVRQSCSTPVSEAQKKTKKRGLQHVFAAP